MQKTGPLHIYSLPGLVENESLLSNLYILGDPAFIDKPDGMEEWVKKIVGLCEFEENIISIRLARELKNTRGSFALILKTNSGYVIAGDIIRSYPLFYGFNNGIFFITDKLENFQREHGRFEIDYDKLEEYISCGLVLGNRTLFKNVYGLQAGEIVTIKDDIIGSDRYFKYIPAEIPTHFESIAEFTDIFDKVLISVFSNMIRENTNVRKWIVPLSGGHDSRLIVNYLYRLGIKNVLCFTYGLANNEQARISKMVADILGYEWHFVEYTEQKWFKLHEKGIIDAYINYSFNGVSIPHLQDFLAIHELEEKGILKAGDILIPGHSAVTNRYNKDYLDFESIDEVARLAYCHDTVVLNSEKLNNKAIEFLKLTWKATNIRLEDYRAFINWQERQSKFTVNSIQVYDFFGFNYRLPFWDKRFVDFWLDYPANQRTRRQLLYEAEENGLLIDKLTGISFAGQKREITRFTLKSRIKKIIPDFALVKLLRLTGHKAKLDEGMNQIYALKEESVLDLLNPINDFPQSIRQYLDDYLQRFTYQVDSNLITRLYTIRKLLDYNKTIKSKYY